MPMTLDQIPEGLAALLMDEAQRQAMEEQLVERSRGDIERTAGNRAQEINESAFGRGLGLSTLNAQAQGENQRVRAEALAKARLDAQQASRTAQLNAMAKAAEYQNALENRRQRGEEFTKSMAQRQSEQRQQNEQFERSRQQQGEQFGRREQADWRQGKMNREAAEADAWMKGAAGLVGAGLQTAGQIWGPEIKGGLKDLFGGPKVDTPTTGPTEYISRPSTPSLDLNYGTPSDYDFSALEMPAFTAPTFDFGDMFGGKSGLSNLTGLDALFGGGSQAYNPWEWMI